MSNPFDNAIVQRPRSIEKSVSGLNDKPLNMLLERFETLLQEKIPRREVQLPRVQFLTSPDAGFGKSHLIGRLFAHLKGKANLVYIVPFEDPGTAWKSFLNLTIDELLQPDDKDRGDTTTQLQIFAHGVIHYLYRDLSIQNAIQPAIDPDSLHTYRLLSMPEKYVDHLQQIAQHMAGRLRTIYTELKINPYTWINILRTIAYCSDFTPVNICLEWIKGNAIDVEDGRHLGIGTGDLLSYEQTLAEQNTFCRKIITDLCHMSGLYRPFVFCFDQTETFGKEPQLASALANIIQILNDFIYNHMTILTTNQKPWTGSIEPYWEKAHIDRLCDPPIQLESVNKQQAREFIHLRLDGIQAEPDRVIYMTDQHWLDEIFQQTLGIRHLIRKCRERWNAYEKIPPTMVIGRVQYEKSLQELFEEYRRKVSSDPKGLLHRRDALSWFIKDTHPNSCSVDSIRNEKYFTLQLSVSAQHYYCGFEEGINWSSWNAIARRSIEYIEQYSIHGIIMFRTILLPEVPKPNWLVAPFIREVQQNGLLQIHVFNKEELIDIYAGREMIQSVYGENLEYTPEQVQSFLRDQYQTIWNRMLDRSAGNHTDRPAVNEKLEKKILQIVKKEKFISFEKLQRMLRNYQEDSIIAAQRNLPEINLITSPTMRVLTWFQ